MRGYNFGHCLKLVVELNELAKTLTDPEERANARAQLKDALAGAVEMAECHGDLLQLEGYSFPNGKAKRRLQQRLKELRPREKFFQAETVRPDRRIHVFETA